MAERHGTCTQVLICRIYDSRQSTATLPWKFCCYCLNYDPVDFETTGHNWCLKLHLNTERLYFADRDKAVNLLKSEMPKCVPAGFNYRPHARQLAIERQFNHHGTEEDVVRSVIPQLTQLIRKTYALLDQTIKIAERSTLSKIRRREVIKMKARAIGSVANSERHGNRQALNRSIGGKLRAKVLANNRDGRCRICGKKCISGDIHIDHIKPVAQGGLTVAANLRVTCSQCNLKRGSGRARSAVAHIPAKKRSRKTRR